MSNARELKLALLELHQQTIVASEYVNPELVEGAQIEFNRVANLVYGELLVQMGRKVASNMITRQVIRRRRIPATRRDAILWGLPSWMQRGPLRPQMEEVEEVVEYHHMCPHIGLRDMRAHYDFMTPPGTNYTFGERGAENDVPS